MQRLVAEKVNVALGQNAKHNIYNKIQVVQVELQTYQYAGIWICFP